MMFAERHKQGSKTRGMDYLRNSRGQSTIEYLIVTFILVATLVTAPSIYETVGHTLIYKYESYSFGIAISDPPRKAIDDTINKDMDMIRHILDVLSDFKDLIKDVLDDIWDKIKHFFDP